MARALESLVFDRATGSWRPVAGMPDGNLLGADGDILGIQRGGPEHIALGAGKVNQHSQPTSHVGSPDAYV